MTAASVATRRPWYLLGFAVMGLTTASTVVTLYLPLIVSEFTDSKFAIGFAVGVEGAVALLIPLAVGQASDQTWNRFGRRLPYMLAATPFILAGLVGVSLVHTYWLIVASVTLFFMGYYAYYTSYQALYPDLLPAGEYGRAWAYQSVFQGVAVGIALLGGGALLTVNLGAPFVATAGFFLAVALATAWLLREPMHRKHRSDAPGWNVWRRFWRRLRQDAALRYFLVMHFCWEFTLAAIRAFVLLYLLTGLGFTKPQLLPLLGVVIAAYLIASIVSGHVVDRFDPRDYTAGMVAMFAACMVVAGLFTEHHILAAILPFGMFAGAAVLMLSYPIMLRVTPEDRRGEYTGYYQFNRGLALVLGTSVTGAAIDALGRYFPATNGYQAFWLITAVVCGLSLIPMFALTRHSR